MRTQIPAFLDTLSKMPTKGYHTLFSELLTERIPRGKFLGLPLVDDERRNWWFRCRDCQYQLCFGDYPSPTDLAVAEIAHNLHRILNDR